MSGKAAPDGCDNAHSRREQGGFQKDLLQSGQIPRAVVVCHHRLDTHAYAHLHKTDEHGDFSRGAHGGNGVGAVGAQQTIGKGGGKTGQNAA